MKPIGIQRKRAKGFKLPPNTVCVDRTSKWGNPFKVGEFGTVEECMNAFKILLSGKLCLTAKASIESQKKLYENVRDNIGELRGKNLACFCAVGKPCHRDILLKIANK